MGRQTRTPLCVPACSPVGHIFFFPAATQQELLGRFGFEVLSRSTGSVKLGLRIAGFLPRKKGWKEAHWVPVDNQPQAGQGVVVQPEKRKPDF